MCTIYAEFQQQKYAHNMLLYAQILINMHKTCYYIDKILQKMCHYIDSNITKYAGIFTYDFAEISFKYASNMLKTCTNVYHAQNMHKIRHHDDKDSDTVKYAEDMP